MNLPPKGRRHLTPSSPNRGIGYDRRPGFSARRRDRAPVGSLREDGAALDCRGDPSVGEGARHAVGVAEGLERVLSPPTPELDERKNELKPDD
jgi:hypothetical protein